MSFCQSSHEPLRETTCLFSLPRAMEYHLSCLTVLDNILNISQLSCRFLKVPHKHFFNNVIIPLVSLANEQWIQFYPEENIMIFSVSVSLQSSISIWAGSALKSCILRCFISLLLLNTFIYGPTSLELNVFVIYNLCLSYCIAILLLVVLAPLSCNSNMWYIKVLCYQSVIVTL